MTSKKKGEKVLSVCTTSWHTASFEKLFQASLKSSAMSRLTDRKCTQQERDYGVETELVSLQA